MNKELPKPRFAVFNYNLFPYVSIGQLFDDAKPNKNPLVEQQEVGRYYFYKHTKILPNVKGREFKARLEELKKRRAETLKDIESMYNGSLISLLSDYDVPLPESLKK
jgi:hypothetical protein